jgi:polysaccharide biosynthesis protein PslG
MLLGMTLALLSVLTPPAFAAQVPGISADLMRPGLTPAQQDSQIALIASVGAGITRVDVGWSALEQNAKGEYQDYYLAQLDALVNSAAQHGVKVLLTFTDSPCWASSAPESLKQGCAGSWWERGVQRYPPANPQDYADALAFLAGRYGGRVAGWEIWNEPNLQYFFNSENRAADYVKLVRAAYPAAKAADPATWVVAGSLSEAPLNFVEQLFDEGLAGHYDAFSLHPYCGDKSPLDPLTPEYVKNSFVSGVRAVHKILREHGQDEPIWLSEFGWTTSTIRNQEPWMNGVDEETQANYVEQALTKVRDWPWVDVALIYELKDYSANRDDRNSNYGLLRYDGTAKPALEAFRRGAAALIEGPPDADPKDVDPDRRLRVRLDRDDERAFARGVGEPRRIVRLRIYRYLRGKHRFARRAAYKAKVKVRKSGRIKHRLDDRFEQGRWRLRAKYTRSV